MFLITHALDEAAMLADRIAVMSARPGRLIDVVETGWPRERDSRIVEHAEFGAVTARLWKTLREESMKTIGTPAANRHEARHALPRAGDRRGVVLLLEVLCLAGVIDKHHDAAAAPDRCAISAVMLVSGRSTRRSPRRLTNAAIAFGLALVVGIVAARGCCTATAPLRETLDPLFATYYAVPIFAFYPLLIVLLRARRRAADR